MGRRRKRKRQERQACAVAERDEAKRREDWYNRNRAEIIQLELANTQGVEKAVLAVGTTGIVGLVAFPERALQAVSAGGPWSFAATLALLALSVVFLLVSLLCSHRGLDERMAELDRSHGGIPLCECPRRVNWDARQYWFYRASIVLLGSAVIVAVTSVITTTVWSVGVERRAQACQRESIGADHNRE